MGIPDHRPVSANDSSGRPGCQGMFSYVLGFLLDQLVSQGIRTWAFDRELEITKFQGHHNRSGNILVMYAGRIVEQAAAAELLNSPLHPYTRALIAAISDPDPQNATTFKDVPPGEPPSLLHPPSGCRFHPRCPAFMKGLCDVKEPPDFEPRPGRLVACWLYQGIALSSDPSSTSPGRGTLSNLPKEDQQAP